MNKKDQENVYNYHFMWKDKQRMEIIFFFQKQLCSEVKFNFLALSKFM